jgi:hypothetical protein
MATKMANLLSAVLDAHGGLEHWHEFSRVEATIVTGGELWQIKGVVQDDTPRQMTVSLHQQRAGVRPFGADDQQTRFTPDRIAIEKLDGRIVAERLSPRDSFTGHEFNTSWDPLHRAYFNGYALWTYLTSPFLLALPGFTVREIEPVHSGGETWTGVEARFPPSIASHSALQAFYFGDDFLLRRHDYLVDVAGGFSAVQFVDRIVDVEGIKIPTRRRAYRCDADGRPDQLMVSIDISNIRFS